MAALSPILRSLEGGRVAFWCPGCDESHAITVQSDGGRGWGYNGNPDAPTFTPSILVTGTQRLSEDEYAAVIAGRKIEPRPRRCHSFVTDGQIRFLDDCTHALAGKTVPLPPFAGEF